VGDVNSVLKSIYIDLELDYKNDIVDEHIKKEISDQDLNSREVDLTAHLPRDVQSLLEYKKVEELVLTFNNYKESVEIYEKIMEVL
jgi:hypothetical protein